MPFSSRLVLCLLLSGMHLLGTTIVELSRAIFIAGQKNLKSELHADKHALKQVTTRTFEGFITLSVIHAHYRAQLQSYWRAS